MDKGGTSDGRWQLWLRWALIIISLVLFVAMPDEVIELLAAMARLVAALFVLKVAWDHGPELKALLAAIASGQVNVEAAGLKLQAKEQDRAAQEELADARDKLAEDELARAAQALRDDSRLSGSDSDDEHLLGDQP